MRTELTEELLGAYNAGSDGFLLGVVDPEVDLSSVDLNSCSPFSCAGLAYSRVSTGVVLVDALPVPTVLGSIRETEIDASVVQNIAVDVINTSFCGGVHDESMQDFSRLMLSLAASYLSNTEGPEVAFDLWDDFLIHDGAQPVETDLHKSGSISDYGDLRGTVSDATLALGGHMDTITPVGRYPMEVADA